MIHTCIGVYPDKSFKINYVSSEKLFANIAYNITYRPGRVYYVDGVAMTRGYMTVEVFIEFNRWVHDNIIPKINTSKEESRIFM